MILFVYKQGGLHKIEKEILNNQIFLVFDYTISKYIKQANKSKKTLKIYKYNQN